MKLFWYSSRIKYILQNEDDARPVRPPRRNPHNGGVSFDLFNTETVELHPLERGELDLGIQFFFPKGIAGLVMLRDELKGIHHLRMSPFLIGGQYGGQIATVRQ
jgi:dUTPase